MARPLPEPHPLAVKLGNQGRLSANTLAAYSRIWRRIERAGTPAATWFIDQLARSAKQAEGDKSRALAKRSVVVMRSAVEWYSTEVEKGDLSALPPKGETGGLRGSRDREHLKDAELAAYNRYADREMEPYRTILLLLPLTGLRVHEICELPVDCVTPDALRIVGKGNKSRVVPLASKASTLLATYMATFAPVERLLKNGDTIVCVFGLYTFESGEPRPEPKWCTPRDLWRAVVRLRAADPRLANIVVHQTRHTTATRLLKTGANMRHIQSILGHESMTTLQRYLHPQEDELRQDLEKL